MIPNDIIYCKPDNLKEASDAYIKYKNEGKNVKFYAGGSEVITMARVSSINVDVVIDLKSILEMQEMKIAKNELIIGSCVTLTRIKDSKIFPLLRFDCSEELQIIQIKIELQLVEMYVVPLYIEKVFYHCY